MQSELCQGINKSLPCPDLAIRQGSDCHKQPRGFLAVTTTLLFLLSFNMSFPFLLLLYLLWGKELPQFALIYIYVKKEPLKQTGTEFCRRLLIILCLYRQSPLMTKCRMHPCVSSGCEALMQLCNNPATLLDGAPGRVTDEWKSARLLSEPGSHF